MKPKLPIHCPSCSSALSVSQLSCNTCQTHVSGNYTMPVLSQLTEDEQQFVLDFFLSSGSLKEMAQKLDKSYPTVRNKLDDMIEKIQFLNKQ